MGYAYRFQRFMEVVWYEEEMVVECSPLFLYLLRWQKGIFEENCLFFVVVGSIDISISDL